METKPLKISYWHEKDILLLKIAPRPAKVDVNRYDFMTRFDEETDEIVGFEILDFAAYFIPHLYNQYAIPAEVLEMRFNVDGGPQNADMHEVLEWAYRRFVVKKDLTQVPTR